MELLRSAVLDVCRQTFSSYSSGPLRVKCHIEVNNDVSQIFSTSFEDIVCSDLHNDKCVGTDADTIELDDDCVCNLRENRRSQSKTFSISDDTVLRPVQLHDMHFTDARHARRLPNSKSNESSHNCDTQQRCAENQNDPNQPSVNQQEVKFSMSPALISDRSMQQSHSINRKLPNGKRNAKESSEKATTLRCSGTDCDKNFEHAIDSGESPLESFNQSNCESVSAIELQNNDRSNHEISSNPMNKELSISNLALSCSHSDSSENLDIVATDECFHSDTESSVDHNLSPGLNIYSSDSRMIADNADDSAHFCTSPLSCRMCLTTLRRRSLSPDIKNKLANNCDSLKKSNEMELGYHLSSPEGKNNCINISVAEPLLFTVVSEFIFSIQRTVLMITLFKLLIASKGRLLAWK